MRDLCFTIVTEQWTRVVARFLPTGGDTPGCLPLRDDILYSFLSLWANLLKFARTNTCEGIAEKKYNVDFVECATQLVKCVSQRTIPIGCFSKAVSVLNDTLPTASDIAMTQGVHMSPTRHLSQFVTRHAESLLESVPMRGGILLFGGVTHGASYDGVTLAVDDRGIRGVTSLIIRSCATTLTSSEGRVFDW